MMTDNEKALVGAIKNLKYSEMKAFSTSLYDTIEDTADLAPEHIADALQSIAEAWAEADAEEAQSVTAKAA